MTSRTERKVASGLTFAQEFAKRLGEWRRHPTLVLDANLSVVWHSAEATRLLCPPSPILLQDGRLSFAHDTAFRVEEFLDQVDKEATHRFLRSNVKGHSALLQAFALPGAQRLVGLVCRLSVPYRSVVDSALVDEIELTRSEAFVLDCFAHLQSPKEIARTLGISLGTVRSHLKQIYSKAGVETGVQLLQLTRGFCDA